MAVAFAAPRTRSLRAVLRLRCAALAPARPCPNRVAHSHMPHGPRHKPVTTVLLSCLLWSLAFRCCYSYYYSSFGSVQIWSLQLPQLVARAIGERTFFSAAASFFSPGRETIVSVHHEKSILCSSSICKSPAESSDEAVLKAKGEYRHGWMDGGVEDGRGKGQNLPSGSAGSQPASHPSQPQRRILVASRGKRGSHDEAGGGGGGDGTGTGTGPARWWSVGWLVLSGSAGVATIAGRDCSARDRSRV